MILYHSTNQSGRDGIEVGGFAVSHGDCPGRSWFSTSPDEARAVGQGWFVVAEIPDHEAAPFSYDLMEDDIEESGMFCIPFEVVNRFKHTFCYLRADEVGIIGSANGA